MALRTIVEDGDEILRKKCREVTDVNDRIRQLVDDMFETMYDADGVGLAAPQVGVLRRLFVADLGDVDEDENEEETRGKRRRRRRRRSEESGGERVKNPMVLINPEIIETAGEQDGSEGCLSVPGRQGKVKRPNYVKIRALDRDGIPVEYEGEGLLARVLCHEYDHLDGVMYIDKATEIWDIKDEPEEQQPKGKKSRIKKHKNKK